MRLHARQATPATLTTTTTNTTTAAAAAAATKHTVNHNNNNNNNGSNNLKATTKTNSNNKKPQKSIAATTLHKIKIKKANTSNKQLSSSGNNNNNNMMPNLINALVTNSTNNNNNNHNNEADANAAAAAAAKLPTTTAEEETMSDMSEDVETTAVELRSTSLHFRGAYNTWRSNSTSAIIAETGSYPTCMAATSCAAPATSTSSALYTRPRTLNVHNARQTPTHQTQIFFGEVLNAWRAKARCNVVPDERTQELFQELSFHPSQKQISEMLQTAKKVARKGSGQSNGLTFGQFCVLAADLKRFRTSTFSNASNFCDVKYQLFSNPEPGQTANDTSKNCNFNANATNSYSTELRSTKSFSSVDDTKKKKTSGSEPVEVFLGGSCNPTTWRADVAIPALKELGISFYNPQVSDWTPDLIELEHRAKEKARVLFFVMDSETRASAGAIEAAHIAGQNCKQLVLVLHPYKSNQTILNEPLSEQEFLDLSRNQMILKELVTRRGLPVLDNIPSGLQRTKDILSGIREPPTKISSILDAVRGAFDRVNPINELLTVEQCQCALLFLGYAQSLLNLDNLNKIIINQRESLKLLQTTSTKHNNEDDIGDDGKQLHRFATRTSRSTSDGIDFDLFCVISAYLSVLQQEIHDSGCISPIKGTNVPPPPVYFTNAPDVDIYFSSVKNISRTSSNASVPSNSSSGIGSATNETIERQNLFELLSRSRDSGTSSPQPQLEQPFKLASSSSSSSTTTSTRAATQTLGKLKQQPQILLNVESIETTEIITTKTIETNVNAAGHGAGTSTAAAAAVAAANATTSPLVLNTNITANVNNAADNYTPLNSAHEEESDDSNDSVFSSSSSIASVTGNNPFADALSCNNLEMCDVYLGGSCVLRSKWRQEIAVPYLKSKGVSYHMPALHESIKQQNFGASRNQTNTADKRNETAAAAAASASASGAANNLDKVHEAQQRSFVRTRRKCRGAQLQLEEEEELTVAEESWSWSLPPVGVRTSLYNPALLDSSRVLLFVITNETRSLAPMTLAAHCIGLMYNVVLAVQMLPDDCVLSNEKLTPAAIKDYNRGRSYLIDLAKRQGVPVFNDIHAALDCTVAKIQAYNNRNRFD